MKNGNRRNRHDPDPGRAGRRWGLCHHLWFCSSWLMSLLNQLADVTALVAPDQGFGLVMRLQLSASRPSRVLTSSACRIPVQAAEPAVGGRRGGRGPGWEATGAGGPSAAVVAAQSALAFRKLAAVVSPTPRTTRGEPGEPRPQHSIRTAFKHTVKLSGSHVGHVETHHSDSAISTFLKEKILRK